MKTVVLTEADGVQLPDHIVAFWKPNGGGTDVIHIENVDRVSELKSGKVRVRTDGEEDRHIPDAEIVETIAD